MSNIKLVEYIKEELAKGTSAEEITNNLLNAGWKREDIIQSLNAISQPIVSPAISSQQSNPSAQQQVSGVVVIEEKPQPQEKKPTSRFIFGIIAFFLIIFSVGGYFAAQYFNKPAFVKQKVLSVQPVFELYSKSVRDISDHLNEKSTSSSIEAMERDADKADSLVKSYIDNLALLNKKQEELDDFELKEYKNSINEYINVANKLLKEEQENIALTRAYIKPYEELEKINSTASTASYYMFSDPDKYITTLGELTNSLNKLSADLKKMETSETGTEFNNAMIELLQVQVKALKKLQSAVRKRDSNALVSAVNENKTESEEISKDMEKIAEKMEDIAKDLANEVSAQKESEIQEYNRLRSKYDF